MLVLAFSSRRPSRSNRISYYYQEERDTLRNQATDMEQVEKYKTIRKIVAIVLLAATITSGLEFKYYRRTPLAVAGKQYWHNERNIQDFQENIPLNLETKSFTQIKNEQDRQNSARNRPSMALIGRTDLQNGDQSLNLGSTLTHPKCPSLKISLGVLSPYNCERSSIQRCIAEKCRRQTEKLAIQEPFYVEEPRWVEIELDYADKLPYNLDPEDPFFVTRGKKIFRATKARNDDMSNDYDDYDDELFNDVPKSTGSSDAGLEDNRSKRNGSKRKQEKNKALQLNNRQLEDLVKHFDPINDPFFLSRGKKHFARDTIQEVSLEDLETEIIGRKSHEETKRSVEIQSKRLENKENVEITNVDTKDNVTSSESNVTTNVSSRTKRNSCSDFDCSTDNLKRKIPWIDDLKKTIFDLRYLQRRDKHSDISDIFNEPYFISRGKKDSRNINYESRSMPIDYNDSSSSLEAVKRTLLRLLDSRKCNSKACKDLDKFTLQAYETMRDRRSSLDDLLRKYDPFYVTRGKRIRSDNPLEKDQQRSRVI